MALCEAPEYGHRDLVHLIDESAPAIVQVLRRRASGRPRVALVSLGPGTGEIDRCLLGHLQAAFDVGRLWCVDTSPDLLRQTVTRIADLAGRGQVQAVCHDFTQLTGVLADPNAEVTLFLLTGFTLGNYNERELLTQIRERMPAGAYLLLDARLHGLATWNGGRQLTDAQRRQLIGGYASPATNRFVFGPVEELTTARIDEVSFAYEIGQSVTAVPNALNITIQCTGLQTRMRVTGEAVERARLDLASTTLYDFDSLLAWFPSLRLEPRWSRQGPTMGLFLLSRSD
jgi:hypothetical protein